MENFKKRTITIICMMIVSIGLAVAQTSTIKHVVDRGETLASIAKRYATTEAKIIELNPDAAQFVYVGMELIIPLNTSAGNTPKSSLATDSVAYKPNIIQNVTPSQNIVSNGSTSSESTKKDIVRELFFSAISFKDVRTNGSYGFGASFFYGDGTVSFGLHSSFSWNAGLVKIDYSTYRIGLGPAAQTYLTENVFIIMPIDIMCGIYNGPLDDKIHTAWAMQISPAVYVGKKRGIFFGPQMAVGFHEKSKPTFGFKTGIYF